LNRSSYVRDKRSPKPKNETVSRVMSANKAKNTLPEVIFRKKLWNAGMRGYRLNYKKIPGRPDIVFVSKKMAIFIHGCFWHRCPYCNLSNPKNNITFWKTKFEKNKQRDKKKTRELKHLGWIVLTIWECQIKKNISNQINKIYKIYETDRN